MLLDGAPAVTEKITTTNAPESELTDAIESATKACHNVKITE